MAAFKALKRALENLGLFSEVRVEGLNRDRIVDLWNAADGPVEATLSTIAMAAFPKAPGVEEGYVATVRALDFVENVLSDKDGKLRQRIFEENVRDYIGADNEVNSEIVAAISDPSRQKRFGILNNGVTLISSDVRVQGNELFLRDFQIVNGCQTSNVLFDQRLSITPDATLMLKVVETNDATLIDEIVRSTNRQTKVQDEQFLATLDCVKAIEKYFLARGQDETYRLFFERRKNQFASSDVKALRVFDVSDVARAAGSMFFDRPELASRYPNRLAGELRDTVFRREYVEDIYYTSAFSLYRLLILFSNKRLDIRLSKLRWYILLAIRYYLNGDNSVHLSSSKIRGLCAKIDTFMATSDENVEQLRSLCAVIVDLDAVTRDQIKSPSFVRDVRQAALNHRSHAARQKMSASA